MGSGLLFGSAFRTAIAMTATPNLALAGSAIASAHTVLLKVENQMIVERNKQTLDQAAHFIGSCHGTQIP